MASIEPSVFDYEDDVETILGSDEEIELLDYDSDTPGPEIITIEDDDEGEIMPDRKLQYAQNHLNIQLPDIEEDTYKFSNGVKIAPGSTLELKDRSHRPPGSLHSGDFLRVKHIIRDLGTDEVRLRGYRLRRKKYLGQTWDWKLNELALVLHVGEDQPGSPFVHGMVDVQVTEILRVRDCVMTNKAYPLLSFRDHAVATLNRAKSNKEAKEWLFHRGRLVCRVVNILFHHKNGKAYGGEVRQLYSHEVDAQHKVRASLLQEGNSRDTSIEINDEEDENDAATVNKRGKRWTRTSSTETLDHQPPKRHDLPTKTARYTFGDCFCGAGGASQGAVQAGMTVCWGLDHDDAAIDAYSQNHLGALPFYSDAHDFPPKGATLEDLKVDVLHLSPPCCYWSPAHTREGRNDQANYEAIYAVRRILAKGQPRVATLEQTFGLLTHQQHKKNFLLLLYDILQEGYDLRYKIVDMSEFGLPQQRKRLLVIAAKRGNPLPPFPRPTHGGPGSGLKRYVSVADALEPLERLGNRGFNDKYHQPNNSKALNKEPYDPQTSLVKGCITTGGGENYHYTGMRKYTPRELCLFQTFPMKYHFSGSQGEATKQIGNAFPPVMAEALYRTIAKTMEAFDYGLISAEDLIDDLDAFLEEKGVSLPMVPSPCHSSSTPRSPYRYLVRNGPSSNMTKKVISSSIFERKRDIEPTRRNFKKRRTSNSGISRERRRVQADAELAEENGDLIMLD